MAAAPQPGRVGSVGARVAGAPASLVRGPTPFQRAAGWVLVVMAVLAGLFAVVLGVSGEAGGLFMCMLFAVAIGTLALFCLCRRAVFDATGIHSRGMLGTRHFPWPDSRGAFMVSTSSSGRGRSEVSVQVPAEPAPRVPGAAASVRMATLAAPRLTVRDAEAARCRLEEDLDGIWAWALQRGYAREITARAPVGPAYGVYGVMPGAAPGGAPAMAAGGAPAPVGMPAPSGAPIPAQADHARVAQEPLVLTSWPGSWPQVLLMALFVMLFCGFGVYLMIHPDQPGTTAKESIVMGHGALTVVFGLVGVGMGVAMAAMAYSEVCKRVTLSRSGLLVFNGFLTRRVPWPASRSGVFATLDVERQRRLTRIHVLAPDGTALQLPGLVERSKDDSCLGAAAQHVETIWAWAYSRGLVRDDGGYLPASKPEVERGRRAFAQRLAYLRARA
ncbi:MAG: hypothetical protein DI576_06575 [Actinomyces sp.]|nr:MAG: hypothetical protein DI576_06575 [Actinomyces sp.]